MVDLSRGTRAVIVGAGLACAAGCSSAPAPELGGAAEPPSVTSASAALSVLPAGSASESDRVRAFLDERYEASAVRYSFNTALGQTVDCVDFFATRGVREMARRGTPITRLPTPPPPHHGPRAHRRDASPAVDPPRAAPTPEGVDENGQERMCPPGTVTEIRITPDEIGRAGGLDAYNEAHRKRPARVPSEPRARAEGLSSHEGSPFGMWPCADGEFTDYAHVERDIVDYWDLTSTKRIITAGTYMSVYAPVASASEHSISQVWLFGGSSSIDLGGTCTSNCVESIEAGWQVDDAVPSKTGTYDGANPYIFTYSTLNGYVSGCWNGDTGSGCPVFIPNTQVPASLAPGTKIAFHAPQAPSASNSATLPTELEIYITDEELNGSYWVELGLGGGSIEYLGYYAASNFTEPLQTFQVGGEAEDNSNDFAGTGEQMGSGLAPSKGYGWAGYQHDYFAESFDFANPNSGTTIEEAGYMCASTPPGYSSAPYSYNTTATKGPSWANYFYYGGCIPKTCATANEGCGEVSDGCGGTLDCGCAAGFCLGHECVILRPRPIPLEK